MIAPFENTGGAVPWASADAADGNAAAAALAPNSASASRRVIRGEIFMTLRYTSRTTGGTAIDRQRLQTTKAQRCPTEAD